MAKPSSADRNTFNLAMRATPWYQGWFRAQGLNPNNVKLTDAQRQQLAQVAAQNRMPLPDGAIIDGAGNANVRHGFGGQPGWLKALEIGGLVTAGALVGGPAVLGAFGHSAPVVAPATGTTTAGALVGSSVPTLTSMTGAPIVAAHAAPAIAASVAPTIAKVAAPAVAKAGFSIADAFKTGFAPALNAVTNLAATRAQTSSNDRAAQIQADAINHAADLQAKAAEEALAFTKGEYTARENRLAPYRQVGQDAITRVGDLVRPGSGAAYLPPPTQYLPARSLVRG